jgi:pimeloyl-ACP methyl ester carboxylesterase
VRLRRNKPPCLIGRFSYRLGSLGPRRTTRWFIATLAVATLAASGCGLSDDALDETKGSTDPSTSGDPTPPADDEESSTPTTDPAVERSGTDEGGSGDVALPEPAPLVWGQCEGFGGLDGIECAELDVPIDYGVQDGPMVTLGLVRVPAAEPSERIGAVLLNPGGPGGSAVDFALASGLPSELTDRFDVVGFDPRGVGLSTPLSCHDNLPELYDADPSPDTGAERDELIEVSLTYIEACEEIYRGLLPHLGTRNVARDMEMVRRALGEPKLNYIGLSYGTSIGQQYAELFPEQIRAMVIDGVVDPGADGLEAASTQAEGFENTFQAFAQDCAERSGCRLGDDPVAVFEDVLAAADEEPIPSDRADRPATEGTVALGAISGLYNEGRWSTLEDAIADAADGDGSGMVDLADDYLSRLPDGSYQDGSEIYFAVSCLDSAWPTDPDDVLDAARAADERAPHFGQATVSDYIRCALWPTEPQPLAQVTAEGSPSIMVVSTTNDPATPYENGVTVESHLANGFLLSVEGDSHVAFLGGNDCVDEAVIDYLVNLTTLPDGAEC